jgi:beta-glucosidase
MKYAFAMIAAICLLAFTQNNCSKPPRLGKDPIKKVIAAMTLEEKAYFVTGTGMIMPGEKNPVPAPGAPSVGQTQSFVPGAAGTSDEIPRLGITAMVMADGPAGLRISPTRKDDKRTYYCTAFPVATMLASTWDTDLAYKVGQAMGNEVLEYGVDIHLAPGMNIHRNPLCGRNFEYYSEDPLITGKIAASMVKGVQSRGVGNSIKHFAANNTEKDRGALNTLVSERALREIYLEGFRIAVEEAQPWTVMSSYNLINDVYASESHDLLTKILRDDWGFKGFVMSDWFGGKNAVAQMNAGNDLLMPGKASQAKALIKAVQDKKLDEAVLDRNIERILAVLLQSPRFKGRTCSNNPDLKAHAAVAREAAADGMVLLKNSSATLPLSSKMKGVAAFGNASYDIFTGGTGSGDVNKAYSISLAQGLKEAGFTINKKLQNAYDEYIGKAKAARPQPQLFFPQAPISEMPVSRALAAEIASAADVALIAIGRSSGEFFDRKEEGDFNLSKNERDLITNVAGAFHACGKRAIVVLNIGGVIETTSWRNLPDAILLAWQGGQEAGNAIADVLSGKVNPSGKLTSTFPVRYRDVPSAKNFPGTRIELDDRKAAGKNNADARDEIMNPKASRIAYEEGIYVGYRYYETFGLRPAYEFGYGLSYTTFEYSGLSLSSTTFTNGIHAAVTVKNTGKAAGREAVQLYVSAPAAKLDKPFIALKGFAKTRMLQPGESQTLEFDITPRHLSSFDPAASSWIAEAGKYEVKIGASSRDIRQKASFKLDRDLVVKKESVALVPKAGINEMKPIRTVLQMRRPL